MLQGFLAVQCLSSLSESSEWAVAVFLRLKLGLSVSTHHFIRLIGVPVLFWLRSSLGMQLLPNAGIRKEGGGQLNVLCKY